MLLTGVGEEALSTKEQLSLKSLGELEYLLSLLSASQKVAGAREVAPASNFPRGESSEALVILAAQIRQRNFNSLQSDAPRLLQRAV